jgi:septal ring factor EnvC (AmiA/AmiB activator)
MSHIRKFFLLTLSLAVLAPSLACSKKKQDNAEVLYIRKKVQEVQAEIAAYESRVKDADHGLQTKLAQELELNKARLERLKQALEKAEDNQRKLE